MSVAPAANDPGSSRTAIWCSLALILFVSAAFNSTFIHYGLNRIDESWQLYAAMRLHAGGTLYEDVMWVFPPGHVWAAWLAWWIEPPGLVQARLIYAAFDLALCGAIYLLARRFTEQPFALLAGLLVALAAPLGHVYQAIFGFRYMVFCVLALLAMDQRLRGHAPYWMVISGALVGAALVFRLTPAFSVSCGIAVALVMVHRKPRFWIPDGLRFAAGLMLVLSPVLLWFSQTVGLGRVWQEVVVHPLAMLQPQALPTLELREWDRTQFRVWFIAIQFRVIWMLYFGYGVALIASWMKTAREERFEHGLLVALTVFGMIFFIRSTGRSDEPHLDSAIPPVCILVAHFLNVCFSAAWRPAARERNRLLAAGTLVAGTVAAWIFLLATDQIVFPDADTVGQLETTQQSIRVKPIRKAKNIDRTVKQLWSHTQPGETILNLGPTPLFHILSGRTGPGYLDVVMPGTFLTVEDETWFLERLKADPPAAIVWPMHDFDGMTERSVSQTAPRVARWALSNYKPLSPQRWIVMVPGGSGGAP